MQLTDGAVALTSAGVTIGATSWPLQAGAGVDFPDPADGQYFAKIYDKTLYSSPEEERLLTGSVEESRVTAKSGDTLTVVRGPDAKAQNTAGHAYEVAVCDSARNLMCVHAYDVVAFGADPSGATESTTAVSAAMVAAETTGHPVYFSAGTYEINSITLTAAASYVLVGDGEGVSTIVAKDSATGPIFVDPATTNITKFHMHRLTIDGNKSGLGSRTIEGIRLEADDIKIQNVEFKNTIKAALRINELGTRGEIAYCDFHDMAVHSNIAGEDTGAFLMNKSVASDAIMWVHHNTVRAAAPSLAGENPYGFLFNCSDGADQTCLIESNHLVNIGQELQGNSSAAIHGYQNCSNSVIQNNVIVKVAAEAIRWQKSSNVLIHHNIINGEAALIATATFSVISLEGRTTVAADERAIVSENIVEGCASFDVPFYATFDTAGKFTDLDILDNQFADTVKGPLLSHVVGSINVRGNKLRDFTTTTIATEHGFELINISADTTINFVENFYDNINVRALYIDHDGTNVVTVNIAGNRLSDVGDSLGTGDGIFEIDDVETVVWSDDNLFTSVAAGVEETLFTNITTPASTTATPEYPITIASDSFAVVPGQNFYALSVASGSSDQLTTITGAVDGQEITLKSVNDAHSITIIHNGGATEGNNVIKTTSGSNFNLTHRADLVRLKYVGDVGWWISLVELNTAT